MRERYIEETLSLIDKAGGLHGLNLREISRALGCAHTNAYNHFNGLEDLVWQATVAALERMMEQTGKALEQGRGAPFDLFIGAQFDFAVQHPGWYRLIWLEPHQDEPPEELRPKLAQPGVLFAQFVAEVCSSRLPTAKNEEIAECVHTYLHGALCKTISGRTPLASAAVTRRQVVARCRFLLETLFAAQSGQPPRKKTS